MANTGGRRNVGCSETCSAGLRTIARTEQDGQQETGDESTNVSTILVQLDAPAVELYFVGPCVSRRGQLRWTGEQGTIKFGATQHAIPLALRDRFGNLRVGIFGLISAGDQIAETVDRPAHDLAR